MRNSLFRLRSECIQSPECMDQSEIVFFCFILLVYFAIHALLPMFCHVTIVQLLNKLDDECNENNGKENNEPSTENIF